MTIEVRRVDPADEAEVRAWWDVSNAAHAERAYNPMRPFELWLDNLRVPNPDEKVGAFGAWAGDELLGTSTMSFPQLDNTHHSSAVLTVPRDRRRRGAGTALLRHWEELARAEGRRTLLAECATTDGADNDGTRFAAAHGFSVANREETKVVSLREAPASWAPLDAEAAARLGDHRIVTVRGAIPDEYVEGYCAMVSEFVGLIPLGDIELEKVDFTPDRLRRQEERAVAQGRDTITAIGLAPDDTPCATSFLNLVSSRPERAYIGITMVLPDHRGHGLGLGVKLATHRALMAAYPGCEQVATGNASANTHMNAINERMGYRVLETMLEMQKKL